MGRANSAAGAGAGAAAEGAMGGNMKGAAMQGGKAAMDDWKKTGAGAMAPPAAPAADAADADAGTADAAAEDAAEAGGDVDAADDGVPIE
jgi:hypothetical protein